MDKSLDNKLPLTNIQRRIGKLMQRSKRQIPCSYLQSRADLTKLVGLRKPYCKAIGVRVTTNDFFFCAIAGAIKKYPLMAGHFEPDHRSIQIARQIGIGFAVAAPQGLVVPVIKDVSEKTLPMLAQQSAELLKKARANKLCPEDFHGADIILSSLGMYGIDSFFAIVQPGTTGIISIGKFQNTIVPVGGDKVIRKIMSVGLAVDNRIVNDVYTAKFLNYVIQQLENPETLTE